MAKAALNGAVELHNVVMDRGFRSACCVIMGGGFKGSCSGDGLKVLRTESTHSVEQEGERSGPDVW